MCHPEPSCGELLKLNVRVAKRTIQRYMRRVRQSRPPGQRWATFLRNHAHETWACDFLQTYDLLFRPIFAFFLMNSVRGGSCVSG